MCGGGCRIEQRKRIENNVDRVSLRKWTKRSEQWRRKKKSGWLDM
jgi:hypothetical protein